MSQKYLSLEETAALLRMPTDEVVRLREKGGLRGFADRGTWKFREDDVQQVLRSRQPDSEPDVPIFVPDSALGSDDDVGEQPTVIRKPDSLKTSDSEVTLIGALPDSSDELVTMDSDSDVKLAGESGVALSDAEKASISDIQITLPDSSLDLGTPAKAPPPKLPPIDLSKFDSDSDVALVGESVGESQPQSDSDVALVGGKTDQITIGPLDPAMGSDSDVRLVSDPSPSGSDSDVKLVEPQKNPGSDSDVALLSDDDQSIALDFTPDEGEGGSVLSDESGIRLSGDSSGLLFNSGSGVKLKDDDDEGITLDIAGDSGISLDVAADSGISLESVADSGISLEDEGFSGTVPMMDVLKEAEDETAFEIPALKDDSEFELSASGSDDETAVFDLEEAESSLDDGAFDLDEGDDEDVSEISDFDEDDDLDVADDILGEDDELDDMDVFDADDDAFDEGMSPAAGGRQFAAPVGAAAPEAEWGGGIFAFLLISTALLVVVGMVMFDLVHTIWAWNDPTPVSSTLLDALGGLYK